VSPFQDYSWWNRVIQRPLKRNEAAGFERLQALVRSICLRRTKTSTYNGEPIISMVQKDVRLIRLDMQQQERSMYDKMWDVVRKVIFFFFFFLFGGQTLFRIGRLFNMPIFILVFLSFICLTMSVSLYRFSPIFSST